MASEEAFTAALASMRLSQSLGHAALEAIAAGCDEKTFVEAAVGVFKQTSKDFGETLKEYEASAENPKEPPTDGQETQSKEHP